MVVLRRLRDALVDGDTVHAVIKASAVNNDRAGKVACPAPSVDGHAAVVAKALAIANVPADTTGFFKAHGIGTAVGDPIEIAAAAQAYRGSTERTDLCRVGSTKSNIGHTDIAAARAGRGRPRVHGLQAGPSILNRSARRRAARFLNRICTGGPSFVLCTVCKRRAAVCERASRGRRACARSVTISSRTSRSIRSSRSSGRRSVRQASGRGPTGSRPPAEGGWCA
jgi:hypothetical protein